MNFPILPKRKKRGGAHALYHYEKTFRLGALVLVIGALLSLCAILGFLFNSPPYQPRMERRNQSVHETLSLAIPFGLNQDPIDIPLPDIEGDLSVSFERMRPGSQPDKNRYCVRIKKNGEVRKVTLPAKLGFKYENGLQFSDSESAFWADLTSVNGKEISAKVCCLDRNSGVLEVGSFRIKVEESPLKSFTEFRDESFKLLGEAKLLGGDLFLEKYGSKEHSQRLSMGSLEWVSLQEGDLLGFLDGKWIKLPVQETVDSSIPLARVSFFDDRTLVFDAWDLDEYFRFSVSSNPPIPLKTKAEEFIGAVRIRSERQISCMLDKQCFVLRSGDWILKEDSRWKVLRKAQEKDDYLQGKLVGDLFVFDRVETKGAQKMLQGFLFNMGRSQMVPVEIAAQGSGKNSQVSQMNTVRKSKGK